ncbi:MAG: DUF92 domain-containing protein [Calditrichia bacterium]
MQDWQTISLLALLIVGMIAIAEIVRRFAGWSVEFTRKFVHISVGIISVSAVSLMGDALAMILVAGSFGLVNLFALRRGLLKSMHGTRLSYGTAFYPLAFAVLLLLCFPANKLVIIAAMLVLSFGDAAAAIVGEGLAKVRTYILIKDSKSFEGSLAMLLVSTITLFLLLRYDPFSIGYQFSLLHSFWFGVATAVVATVAEALSHKGSDNLSVPFSTAIILYFFLSNDNAANLQLTMAIVYALLTAGFSIRFRFLTPSGATALFLLAVPIFGFGGWKWTIPILAFFILSSLLSKIGKARKTKQDELAEKESRRDYAQAFANGGLAGILMISYMFYANELFYFLYLAALAAATADTWATELGSLAKQTPYLITNGEAVPAGTSGGVTTIGLVSSLAGSAAIAVSGIPFSSDLSSDWQLFLFVVAAGFLASLFDSLLGATVQVRYSCTICGKDTERRTHCGKTTDYKRGWKWLNNNWVNALCTVSAVLFLLFFLLMTFIYILYTGLSLPA